MILDANDRLLDFDRAECAAWVTFAVWTGLCAFPAWTVPDAWHYALAGTYGLLACGLARTRLYRWSAGVAGCAGACLSSLNLRLAAADHGLASAVAGTVLSTVAAALLLAVSMRGDLDEHGRVPATRAAVQLSLACVLAGYISPVWSDLVAWLAR